MVMLNFLILVIRMKNKKTMIYEKKELPKLINVFLYV